MPDLPDSITCYDSFSDCVCLSFIVNIPICHHLIHVHLYKFFTCLDINKMCLNHQKRWAINWQKPHELQYRNLNYCSFPFCALWSSLIGYSQLFRFMRICHVWKPLCSGMGEVVPARTSPTLLPPSPRTVLSLSCFKVSQCINCRD